jgi:replicative DNA helicase
VTATQELFALAPPHDLAAEQVTLGGMMMDRAAILDVVDSGIDTEDFYRPAHHLVYQAIMTLFSADHPTGAVAVAELLTRQGDIGLVGGAPYLHTLMASAPAAANAGYYAGIVRDKAILRRMVETGTRIVQIAQQADGTAEELAGRAGVEWLKVLRQLPGGNLLPIGPDVNSGAALEQVRPPGIMTGFRDLDLLTGGLQPGQFLVIAGRPGLGKSTLALDLARTAAIRDGHRVGFFSLEMSRMELILRLIAAQARVQHLGLRELGKPHPAYVVSEEEWARIARHTPDIAAAPFLVDDTPHMSMNMIRTAALKQAQLGKPLELIIIDYLQLIRPATRDKGRNRQEEVSGMTRDAKLLGKELGVPVVVCAQLNRGPEQRADHRPVAADLRESGSVEQDADQVWLLHREDAYERESPRAGEADIIVAKHRGGPTATITVAFQGHYSRFVTMARI